MNDSDGAQQRQTQSPVQVMQVLIDGRGWPYTPMPELGGGLRVDFSGTSGNWACLCLEAGEGHGIVLISICPVACPAEARPRAAEFCLRANQALVFASLELDFDSGEVRLKSSLPTPQGALTPELAATLLETNLAIFDRHLPALLGVMYGTTTPTDALAELLTAR